MPTADLSKSWYATMISLWAWRHIAQPKKCRKICARLYRTSTNYKICCRKTIPNRKLSDNSFTSAKSARFWVTEIEYKSPCNNFVVIAGTLTYFALRCFFRLYFPHIESRLTDTIRWFPWFIFLRPCAVPYRTLFLPGSRFLPLSSAANIRLPLPAAHNVHSRKPHRQLSL